MQKNLLPCKRTFIGLMNWNHNKFTLPILKRKNLAANEENKFLFWKLITIQLISM